MITKLCIICLCVVGCSMVGLKFNKDSAERVRYYENLLLLINNIISTVQFRQESLKSVLLQFTENNKSTLNTTIQEFLKHLDDNAVEFKPSKLKLKPDEMAQISDFFCSLGHSDSETQLFELNAYKNRFEEKKAFYAEKHKKFGGLFLKLSFMLGLALGILII